MALFNEILVGRYNRLLQKLLSMKGDPPSPQLAGDLTAGITLESDRIEYGFLSGEMKCVGTIGRAADAANFGVCGLFNGTASGALVVVEGLVITNQNAAIQDFSIILGGATGGLANTTRGLPRDLRFLTKQSTAIMGNAVEAALTGTIVQQYRVIPGDSIYVPLDVVLPPNSTLQPFPPNICVAGGVINIFVRANFLWRERQLESSEAPAGV